MKDDLETSEKEGVELFNRLHEERVALMEAERHLSSVYLRLTGDNIINDSEQVEEEMPEALFPAIDRAIHDIAETRRKIFRLLESFEKWV